MLGRTARLALAALTVAATYSTPQISELQYPSPQEVLEVLGFTEDRGQPADFVPGQAIVKWRSPASIELEVLSAAGAQSIARMTSGGELIVNLFPSEDAVFEPAILEEDLRQRTLSAIEQLSANPNVEYAHPNWLLLLADTNPNDANYKYQWHYWNSGQGAQRAPGGISLPKAWDQGVGSREVVVAVIDTGMIFDHPDVSGSANLLPGYDMVSDPIRANDHNGRDPDATDAGDGVQFGECGALKPAKKPSWHGTHVAGTIGAGITNNGIGIAGVSWNVRVLPVRVIGKCGATLGDLEDAIRWAAGITVGGVPNPNPAQIINMSLSARQPCTAAQAIQRAINDAVAAGAVVVVAAGNDGRDAGGAMPASCGNVIAVAASDFNGHLTDYSNYGAVVDILAPGGDVNQDANMDGYPDGVLSMVRGGYALYQGTSMAAPHVAGVLALKLSRGLSLHEAVDEITTRAIPRASHECHEPCGVGLLNAR